MFIPRSVRDKAAKSNGQKSTVRDTPVRGHTEQTVSGDANKPVPGDANKPVPGDTGKPQLPTDSANATSESAPPLEDQKDTAPKISKPPPKTPKPEHLAQVLCGVELIFTDYAHQDPQCASWLQERYRVVDGEANYIHFSGILEHPNISSLKPVVTQTTLLLALQEKSPKSLLEVSKSGYHVRRQPSSYPLRFIPTNSFQTVNDEGVSFWDERTIYIEPHTRDLSKTPAKVAWWLQEHGEVRDKWLPIQHVKTLYNSCAFVMLSGNVHHAAVWKKWREKAKLENWNIMTKAEHTQRTNEYLELLKHDNPKMLQKDRKSQTKQVEGAKSSMRREKIFGLSTRDQKSAPQRTTPRPAIGKKRELEEALPIRKSEEGEAHKGVKRIKTSSDQPQGSVLGEQRVVLENQSPFNMDANSKADGDCQP